jgi:hypothetical protein
MRQHGKLRRDKMTIKSTLICATAIAIALTSFDLRPAAAASEGAGAIAKQNSGADEFSAARKRRRGVNPAIPLAAFGAIVGTIGAVAAANARRDYYERHYYAPGYYGAPAYGYYAPPAYQPYAAPAPVYRHYGYRNWHGPVGAPPVIYGHGPGGNGQMPPSPRGDPAPSL